MLCFKLNRVQLFLSPNGKTSLKVKNSALAVSSTLTTFLQEVMLTGWLQNYFNTIHQIQSKSKIS